MTHRGPFQPLPSCDSVITHPGWVQHEGSSLHPGRDWGHMFSEH